MNMTEKRTLLRRAACLFAVATAAAAADKNTVDPACVTDSSGSGLIRAWPCAEYGRTLTRHEHIDGVEQAVSVDYLIHRPSEEPKALVVLLTGGNGDAGLAGDTDTGTATASGNNFLVRSAQLFAERGYLAVTLNWPSDQMNLSNLGYDLYRVSARHAADISGVVSAVNTANLDVFLAGTSRAAESVVANHLLGTGISLPNPVTSGSPNLYVGHPAYHNLQPEFVTVPVHMLVHPLDQCPVSNPADAPAIFGRFTLLNSPYPGLSALNRYDQVAGGFTVSSNPCSAQTFHGFLGIENSAVNAITTWMDGILGAVEASFPGNGRPLANYGEHIASAAAPAKIDLSRFASDPDGDPLTFYLPYLRSNRGAQLTIDGTVVTYTPSGESDITDGFVFAASDGRGKISSAPVGVEVRELSIAAAVLPASRSVSVGSPATAFATIVNTGNKTATDCFIAPPDGIAVDFSFQTTDPATNALTGTPDTAANVSAGGFQSFVVTLTPNAEMQPTDVKLAFVCSNSGQAEVVTGLNTLLLSASAAPTPDIVALAATPSGDGVVSIPSLDTPGIFSVATVNLAASGSITVSADTGTTSLPLSIALCATDPLTGACVNPAVPDNEPLSLEIGANSTPTFALFVTATEAVSFDPATHRIFVRFRDASGESRGATSVAVRTP